MLFFLLSHMLDNGCFMHSHRTGKFPVHQKWRLTNLSADVENSESHQENFPVKYPLSVPRYLGESWAHMGMVHTCICLHYL